MANRSFRKDIGTPNIGLVIVPGSVTIPSGGLPTTDTITFCSASRRSTGLYRLQFEDSFVSLMSSHLTLEQAATGSAPLMLVISGSSMSGKYVDVYTMNTSGAVQNTATPIAIHFTAMFKNSGV